jgi:dTDP-glucose pyrophosphorylase
MRLFDEKRQLLNINDYIIFTNSLNNEIIKCQIVNLYQFKSFKELYENFDPICLGYEVLDTVSYHDMEMYYSIENINKYGIVETKHIEDRVYKVKGLMEKPNIDQTNSDIAILGRYIVTPKIFEILENLEPGKGGEIQLTDALLKLSKEEAIYAYIFEGKRYDVGDKLGFLQATVEYALRRDELKNDFLKYLKEIIKE